VAPRRRKHAFDWALDDELIAACGDALDHAVQVETVISRRDELMPCCLIQL
jgi:hypothetical protein